MCRYNNDEARYVTYPVEEWEELEATFLSNVRTTFDPTLCSQNFKACLLPQWSQHMKEQYDRERAFVLRFTMDRNQSNERTNNIRSIEQVSFNFESRVTREPFPRNVRRLIDTVDCIEFLYRDSSTFSKVCSDRYLLCSCYQCYVEPIQYLHF